MDMPPEHQSIRGQREKDNNTFPGGSCLRFDLYVIGLGGL